MILYQGKEIIGYAHIQLWPDERAAMRIIMIDEGKRKRIILAAHFLALCKKSLKCRNYKSIYVESSPKALAFYRNKWLYQNTI